ETKRAGMMFGKAYTSVLKSIILWDTFLNLIRGRNQMRTQELVSEAATYHEMIEKVCRRLCELVKLMIRSSINDSGLDVRVSVSALSKDRSGLEYLARDPRSAPFSFQKRSVAWFATILGEPRWYLKGWKDSPERFLLDVQNENEVPEDSRQAMGDLF